jgi:hypothetical protein
MRHKLLLALLASLMLAPQLIQAKTAKKKAAVHKSDDSDESSSSSSGPSTSWGVRGDLGYGASQNSGEAAYFSGGTTHYVPYAPSAGFGLGVEATYEFSKYIEFGAGLFPTFAGDSYNVNGAAVTDSTTYVPLVVSVYGRLPLMTSLNLLLGYGLGIVPGTQTHTTYPLGSVNTSLNMGTAYRSFAGAEYWLNPRMNLVAGLQDLTMDNTVTTNATPGNPSRSTNYTVDFNQIALIVAYGFRF